jgi:hypothetical protein
MRTRSALLEVYGGGIGISGGGGGAGSDLASRLARLAQSRSAVPAPVGLALGAAIAGTASPFLGAAACEPPPHGAPAGKPYLTKPTLFDAFAPMPLAQTLALAALTPFAAQITLATRRGADARKAGGVKGETHDSRGKKLTPLALVDWAKLREDAAFNCVKALTAKVLHSAAQLALWHCLDGEQGQRCIAKIVKNVAASAVSELHRANPPPVCMS